MGSSKIEWTDVTWNPITGCSKVSPACDHCYARRMSNRLAGRFGYPGGSREPGADPFAVTFHPDRLDEPLRWRKPRRVFVCSMGDLFHEDVTDDQIHAVFTFMSQRQCWKHTFMLLTKRPERMCQFITARIKDGTVWREGVTRIPLPNVWLGVTAEDQQRADERIPVLLATPAARRFVSAEPLLGPVDLTAWLAARWTTEEQPDDGMLWPDRKVHPYKSLRVQRGLNWVIVGGENGAGARPMHPKWASDILKECREADVPFFFKGSGLWVPEYFGPEGERWLKLTGIKKGKEIIFHSDEPGTAHPINMHRRHHGEKDEINSQYRQFPEWGGLT